MYSSVNEYYNQWHDQYLKHYGDTIQAHRSPDLPVMHKYIQQSAGMQKGMRLLDAGCGVGGPAVYFAAHCAVEIDGVNISERQLEHAKLLVSKNKLQEKIRLHQQDFHKVHEKFAEETFDMVYFLESFGHATDKLAVLTSAATVLKKNGIFYIKDYFAKEITGSAERQELMRLGVKNMNREYCYQLADLYETLKLLRCLSLDLIFVKRPGYEWDNTETVDRFEKENGIDLFDGYDKPQIVEPLELKFVKTR